MNIFDEQSQMNILDMLSQVLDELVVEAIALQDTFPAGRTADGRTGRSDNNAISAFN